MKYTKKQHFISRYILKRFLNKNNKIDAVLINENRIRRISTNTEDICVERDFYEDKDAKGQYIDRNRTENKFAAMEREFDKKIDSLIIKLLDTDASQLIKDMIKSGEWEYLSVWLMFHLTLVMIRLPKFKELVFEKNEIPFEIQQVLYKNLIWGREDAERLAENLFEGLNLDTIYSVIRKGENKDAISTLMNYLINNYYVEIYMTPENKKFYLTDNPVIVNDISNIDYFLPLSPNVAMVLKKITSEAINIQVLPVATARMVDGVNSYLIQKAERIIIVQDMTDDDFKYINKIRKRE